MTNAERFISSYNKIDKALRNIYGYKAYFNFTDIIRKASLVNYVVRKYDQKLIDFARLRNAIVHQTDFQKVIAEPHLEVVEEFEAIVSLVCTPPNALESIAKKNVITLNSKTKLVSVIKTIYETQYSNIPILEDKKLIGVVNNKLLIENLATVLENKKSIDVYLRETEVKEILSEDMMNVYYTILSEKATLVDVMNEFEKNRKLVVLIITKNGNNLETLLGIITAYDIVEVTNILDNYE